MTRRDKLKLFADSDLSRYITEQARRHFRDPMDQADARQEAWERILKNENALNLEQYKREALRAINNLYMRRYRLRRRETLHANT